jgi:hypothetical protein
MTAEPRLATRLEELAETPAPPMGIDIEHARRLGQRRLYTRRASLITGAAVFAGAATLVAPSILRRGPASVPALPTSAPTGNPLIAYADFGWLPDSITRVEHGTRAHEAYVHAVDENARLGTHLWVSVHPAGALPEPPNVQTPPPVRVPAPAVNGQPAYWLTDSPSDPGRGASTYLLWPAPDRTWVRLHGYYLSSFPDPLGILHRVASGITVETRPLPLPVRIDLPDRYRVDEANFYRPMPKEAGTGAWQLRLYYPDSLPGFTIFAHPEGTFARPKEGTLLPTRTAKGVDVCVAAEDYEVASIRELGGAQGILDRITPLGLDQREWTIRPLG